MRTEPQICFPMHVAAELCGVSAKVAYDWKAKGYVSASIVPQGWRRPCQSLPEVVQMKAMVKLHEQEIAPDRASLLARTLVNQELRRLVESARAGREQGEDAYLVVAVNASRRLPEQLFLDVAVGAHALQDLLIRWDYDKYPAVIVLSLGAIMSELLSAIRSMQDAGRLPFAAAATIAADELLHAAALGSA